MSVRIISRGGPRAMAKHYPKIRAKGFAEVGDWWHGMILPGHFDTSAQQKYGYQPRTAKYAKRKGIVKHHQLPLVWSGEAMQMLTSMARISESSKGVDVRMTGPRHFYAFRKDYRQADKAAEVTRVSTDEIDQMNRIVDDTLTEELDRLPDNEVIGGGGGIV